MPVEQVPGFWDYLGEGIQRGVTMHRESEDKKRADAQANAELMTQLFQSGAVDASQLQGALKSAGINPDQVVVQPNKAQRRREVLAGGQEAVDSLGDAMKEDLGFKTTTQKKTEKASGAQADLSIQKSNILSRFLAGDKISDQEAEAVGVLGTDDRELKRLTQLDPYLGQLGERYVAGEMVKSQGRIKPGTAQQVAENAYATYVSERGQNGLGPLTPEQVSYTRTFFQRATENALVAQAKMDITSSQAGSARIHANAAMEASGQNSSVKWFTQVNSAIESVRKAQNDIMRSAPALSYALGAADRIEHGRGTPDDVAMVQSPMVAGALTKYKELEQTGEAFRSAQGALANGQVPGNLSALLDAASQITTGGAGASVLGSPQRGGRGGPPPNASNSPDPIGMTVDAIMAGKATMANVQAYLKAGKIAQQQYDQIVQQVRAKQSSKRP